LSLAEYRKLYANVPDKQYSKPKGKLSVLAVVCSQCSYNSVQDICARRIKLEGKELPFLTKTFPRLANERINLDIGSAGGDNFFDAVNTDFVRF